MGKGYKAGDLEPAKRVILENEQCLMFARCVEVTRADRQRQAFVGDGAECFIFTPMPECVRSEDGDYGSRFFVGKKNPKKY